MRQMQFAGGRAVLDPAITKQPATIAGMYEALPGAIDRVHQHQVTALAAAFVLTETLQAVVVPGQGSKPQ